MKEEEEEECDEFPFNMSDFVTVDEVGDVTDLPRSPSPAVPMETTEGEEDAPGVRFSSIHHMKLFLYMVIGVSETFKFHSVMTSWSSSCFLLLGHTHGGYHGNKNVRRHSGPSEV